MNGSDDTEAHRPPPGAILRGVAAALACDTALTIPLVVLVSHIHARNVIAGVVTLLQSANILVGYVGGRVAARAGLSHEDSRSQWTMTMLVAMVSIVTSDLIPRALLKLHLIHLDATADQGGSQAQWMALFFGVALLLLVRFGFAMGTFAQAKREGRAQDDEDESESD